MRWPRIQGFVTCSLSVLVVVAPGPQRADDVRPGAADRASRLGPRLHEPLPADPADAWFVPDETTAAAIRSAPVFVRFRAGVDRYLQRDYAGALASWSDLDRGVGETPLAHYLEYYRGLVALAQERWAEARRRFAALSGRRPLGYLAEAAVIGQARAAEGEGDYAAAVRFYEEIAPRATGQPDQVWLRLGQAALAAGDRARAASALARVRYGYPLSAAASVAGRALDSLRDVWVARAEYVQRELDRAERLFQARRYDEARAAFLAVRSSVPAAARRRVDLRIVACDLARRHLGRARTRLQPYLGERSRDPEVAALYLDLLRRLGRTVEYVRGVDELVKRFPSSPWTEAALDGLANFHLSRGDRAAAARVFATLYEQFPTGAGAERAAWHAGWWAYRTGDFQTTVRLFEEAAAAFPRSDYRPAYLYWAGRAHDRLGNRAVARARYELVVVDYGQSYYGRLAARRLSEYGVAPPTGGAVGSSVAPAAATRSGDGPAPPTEPLIRFLLALELYDDALNEIRYAAVTWGSTAALDATEAWVHHRRGELRRAVQAMKRAYPQYRAAIGASLPEPLLRVLFPLAFWDRLRQHAQASGLDPFLLAALVAQESTFDPAIRSAANAYGLMQLLPETARRVARSLGVRGFRFSMLTNPDWNLRLGTTYLARLLERFGALHLALAAYNAGEHRVARWLAERRDLAPEEFIEDIPFAETRNYIKKVLGTMDDYRRLYGGTALATP